MIRQFKKLNIQNKMMYSSWISVGLILIVGILSWLNMNEMRGTINQLEEGFLPKAGNLGALNDLYWMRRIRAVSLVGSPNNAGKRTALLSEIQNADKEFDKVMADYRERAASDEEKKLLDDLSDFIDKDRADISQLASLMNAGKQQEALKWQERKSTGVIAQSDQYFDALKAFNAKAAEQAQGHFKQTDQILSIIFYSVNSIAFWFMIAFSWWFSNLLGRALKNLTEAAKRVAAGDLTGSVERIDSGDEIGELSLALDEMLRSIRQIIRELKEKAAAVAASSDEMEKTSIQMDSTADVLNNAAKTAFTVTEQLEGNIRTVAASVEQAASNVKEVFLSCKTVDDSGRVVGKSADKLADNMQTMAAAAEEMSASVNTVAAAIEEMTASLGEVARSAAQAASVTGKAENMAASTRTTVNALGESAQEIDKVVDLIQSIAAQTNLLALNATIEASSAGEAGKGFAVVAKEVKELAKQAADATEVIRGRIEEMKGNTSAAINAIGMITDTITQINDINNTIASSVEQQAATVQEVSRNVSGVATAAVEVSRNVLNSATLAQDVAEKAEQTNSAVAVITRNLEDMDRGTIEISNSAQEAAIGADRMSTSIAGVQTAAVDTNHGAGEIKHSAGTLTELSGQLVQLVGRFHLHQNFVNWTPAYSVGSRKIDVQHQRLFELVNQLHEAIQTGTDRIVMSGILDELIEYTASHFGLEEKLMQQTNYPHYVTHKEQHDTFVAQVLDFRKKFQAREADLNQEVMDMLVNWLTKHINGTDKQYSEHFQKTGVA